MKVYFIKGFPHPDDSNIFVQYFSPFSMSFPMPEFIIKELAKFLLLPSSLSMGLYRKYENGSSEICIVKQKHEFFTIIITLHELFHFFIDEIFGNKKKMHDLFDKLNFISRKIL